MRCTSRTFAVIAQPGPTRLPLAFRRGYPASASSAAPLQLVLVGSDRLVYQGLKALLHAQADMDVLEVLAGFDELSYLIGHIAVDVFIMDWGLGTALTCSWLRKLSRRGQSCLILTRNPCQADQQVIERAGGLGYLSLQADTCDLFSAIRRVAYGQPVFYPITAFASSQQAGVQAASRAEPLLLPGFGTTVRLQVNLQALEQALQHLQRDFTGIEWVNEQLIQILPYLHYDDAPSIARACGLPERRIRYCFTEKLYPLVSQLCGEQISHRATALMYLLFWHIVEFDQEH